MTTKLNLAQYLAATFLFTSTAAISTPIIATDFNSLNLGAMIVGPVGPEVEVSLSNTIGDSLGDLRSSVSCPDGFTNCLPATNVAGTIYTYTHTVIPGVDNPNDAPFPNPVTVLPFDDVLGFSLGFEATGFNGVAGYSFSDASVAGVSFDIELEATGELIWTTDSDNWDTAEEITFFWQTTQAPSGPAGVFSINSSSGSASGQGPLPTALAVSVSEPYAIGLFMLGLIGLLFRKNTFIKAKL